MSDTTPTRPSSPDSAADDGGPASPLDQVLSQLSQDLLADYLLAVALIAVSLRIPEDGLVDVLRMSYRHFVDAVELQRRRAKS